jgi:hypothetical protein
VRARRGPARAAARAAGASIYRLTAAATLLSHGAETRTLTLSWLTPAGVRRDETVEVHGAFVTNQRYCGGGLSIPSGAVDDDGVFELCLVPRTSRARLLDAFSRLSLGLAVPPSVLRVIPARERTWRSPRRTGCSATGRRWGLGGCSRCASGPGRCGSWFDAARSGRARSGRRDPEGRGPFGRGTHSLHRLPLHRISLHRLSPYRASRHPTRNSSNDRA